MRVTVVGKQMVSYDRQRDGKKVEGISLFYTSPKDGVDGLFSGNIWVPSGSALHEHLISLDVKKPVLCDVSYEMLPGSRYPQLMDVKVVS
jgi:hypothetical protein